jgi:hypothetical protein
LGTSVPLRVHLIRPPRVAGRAAATSVKRSYDTIVIPGGPWRNPHTGQGLLTEYANLAPLC